MTITLPDEMREELERKAKAGGFETVDEYSLWLLESDILDEDVPTPLTVLATPPGSSLSLP
jgi:hypothetical protein